MRNIEYIESKGFRVVGRYIYKKSERTNRLKPVGQLNENNFYFYSENVYPFKSGVNFFNEKTLTNPKDYKKYIKKEIEKDRNDFNVSYQNYYNTTTGSSVFENFLNSQTRKFLNKNFVNYFNIRGISKGYMEDAVAFPFIDSKGNFKTAQIIRYASNGKRVKNGFSTNWLHSYKPIKKDLNLSTDDKYSVKVDCFFGENYLEGSNNIVAIVEAPKTAVILKEIYPNIDWIATAGETALFNKNLDCLRNKNVILFADAHTTKWREFGLKQGFITSDILDKECVAPGDDLADYIFDSEFKHFNELHEYLFALNLGDFNFKANKDAICFNFERVGNDKGYFTAVPTFFKGNELLLQRDNSRKEDISFTGNLFNIYKDKYDILNAQIDWHKQDTKIGNELVGFNEISFKYHLQKCFRALKEFNPNSHLEIFKSVLKTLNKNSNFRFNEYFVLNRLVPIWDGFNVNLKRFHKPRDWKYKGNVQLSREDFERELNNERFRNKLNTRLLAFRDVLNEDRFIDIETDLGLKPCDKQRGYVKIFKLVKQWNENVIGCKTLKTYFNKVELYSKIVERFNDNIKSYHPYNIFLYGGDKILFDSFSTTDLSRILGIKDKSSIKRFLLHKSDRELQTFLPKEIDSLLIDVKNIEPLRNEVNGKTKIYDYAYIEPINERQLISRMCLDPKEAFLSMELLLNQLEAEPTEQLQEAIHVDIKYLEHIDKVRKEKVKNGTAGMSNYRLRQLIDTYDKPKEQILRVVNF